MRAHGVPNFPDPVSGGGGFRIQINPRTGLSPFSPTFRTAQAACKHLLPGGGPSNGPPSAQVKARMLAIAECMRAHGVTDFPDPTTTPPSGPGGFSAVMGSGGLFLEVPRTISVDSPAFRRASTACSFGRP